jgi:hypothetical protein
MGTLSFRLRTNVFQLRTKMFQLRTNVFQLRTNVFRLQCLAPACLTRKVSGTRASDTSLDINV